MDPGTMCIHSSTNVLGAFGGVVGSLITTYAINYPFVWVSTSIFLNFVCCLDKNHSEITSIVKIT